jgi:hypothetical protein
MQMAMLVQGISFSGNELELLVERSMRIDQVHALSVAQLWKPQTFCVFS